MLKRLPIYLRHVAYNLRGGFLIRPLIITLTLGIAGTVISVLEQAVPKMSAWVPAWIFPSRSDPQVAQVILGGIAASVMTVVSIVFAILLMTLTLASMQFSPRIIVGFAKDRVTQWTLGIFLGTFSYCVAALPAAHTHPTPFEPVVTVLGAMALALMCVAWLLFFIHHISQAISVNYIVDRIAFETEAMILETMPEPVRLGKSDSGPAPVASGREAPVISEVSGYVRFVDVHRLKSIATEQRMAIYVQRRVGHFVPAGVPLMLVSKEDRLTPELESSLRAVFDIGPARTLQQDIEFGILQIVDIALKAISPAVNDPTTGIACVDQISRILILFASREQPETSLYEPPGTLRVWVPPLSLPKLVDSAFEQIRIYAKGDFAVSLRLLRALSDLSLTVPDKAIRTMLLERGQRVLDGLVPNFQEGELIEVRSRLASLAVLANQIS